MLHRIVVGFFLFSMTTHAAVSKEYAAVLLKIKNEKTSEKKLKSYNELKSKLSSQVEKLAGKEKFNSKETFEIELGGLLDLYPESAFKVMNCESIQNQIRTDFSGKGGVHLSQAATFLLKLAHLLCKK